MRFPANVWVKGGEFHILPVSTVKEAQAILRRWPDKAKDAAFAETLNILKGAAAGAIPLEDARRSFVALLEKANILGESNPA